ncbi:MAG: PDDEXK nuclease domain-containing protein [Sideroxyarcus sp.]|nr:PDDEXK nuclease domain-containing protein [Sideroxyarcus sp.]
MPSKPRKPNQTESKEPRLSRGRTRPEAIFPVAPLAASLPESYAATLQEIKNHLRHARLRAVLAANPIVIEAYWQTGQIILARQQEAAWGARVIDRLAADLKEAFPDMSGLSPRNLLAMKVFAREFPDGPIAQQAVAQLPWGHVLQIMQRVKDPAARDYYIREAITHGWSRSILEMNIRRQLHLRAGKAQNNFALTMPPADSDMAAQLFKDPYLFDFLGTADPRREAEVEQALVDHIQKFLLELGSGFAFVGRQVRLEVGDEDYPLDLLFYHLRLRRYVVIELKARAFTPGDVGQLNLYLSAVDDLLRHPDDQPTIGLLLCRKKNKLVAEYALRGLDQSIAVAAWQTQLTETLPQELKGSLPTVEEIEAELAGDMGTMEGEQND